MRIGIAKENKLSNQIWWCVDQKADIGTSLQTDFIVSVSLYESPLTQIDSKSHISPTTFVHLYAVCGMHLVFQRVLLLALRRSLGKNVWIVYCKKLNIALDYQFLKKNES